MDKELINVLSKLLDEKLEPIKEQIVELKEDVNILKENQNSIIKRIDTIEYKFDMIHEQVVKNAEDIADIRKDLTFMEDVTAKNSYNISKYLFENVDNKRG